MQTKTLLVILFLVLAVSVGYWFILDGWQTINDNNKVISEKQQKIISIKDEISKVDQVMSKINDPMTQNILKAIPVTSNRLHLLLETEALVLKSGMAYKSITIGKEQLTPTNKKTLTSTRSNDISLNDKSNILEPSSTATKSSKKIEANDFESLEITFNVSGNYERLNNFLKILESELRIMNVQSFSYSALTKNQVGVSEGVIAADGPSEYTIVVKTYYVPNQ